MVGQGRGTKNLGFLDVGHLPGYGIVLYDCCSFFLGGGGVSFWGKI